MSNSPKGCASRCRPLDYAYANLEQNLLANQRSNLESNWNLNIALLWEFKDNSGSLKTKKNPGQLSEKKVTSIVCKHSFSALSLGCYMVLK